MYEHAGQRRIKSVTGRRLPPPIDEILERSRVLDVGCGNGWLRHHCRSYAGYTISDTEYQYLKSQNIEVYKAKHEIPSDDFDCIVMNHFLEHIPQCQITQELNSYKRCFSGDSAQEKYIIATTPTQFGIGFNFWNLWNYCLFR